MSVKNKLNAATKATEKMEKTMIKEMQIAYSNAYKNMKVKMKNVIDEFGVDGKLSSKELNKYNRMKVLSNNLEKELKVAESLQANQMKTYLKDAYELNYYYAGYAAETESLVKLNYAILDRKQVAAAINNPLMNIAIDDNKRATRAKIRRALAQSVAQGEGIQDVAGRIKKATNYGLNRSVKIARTETTGIMGKARQQGFEHAEKRGLKMVKKWISTKDDRTRDRHQDLDGETVALDKSFSNGLMYPGDPSGPPEEIINCRCTHITEIEDVNYEDWNISETKKLGEYQNYKQWVKDRL